MANRLAKSYVLRITPKQGEPFTYATHLGSSLSIARDKPIESVALMLDGHVVDTFEGRWRSHVQFDRALWG